MSYPSKHSARRHPGGFTLVESMAAVTLLTFIGAGVWLVMERCMASAADTTQRTRAFEIARENMEKLIGSPSVQEMTELGVSEQFPDIRWQNTVESFDDPLTARTWVRAVCSAEYTDSAGETQTIELTHWLTDLTDDQTKLLQQKKEQDKQQLTKHIIAAEDLAAQYAGVNVETIRQWVKNGMPTTGDGAYLKPWLDLYLQTDGNPTSQDKQDTITEYPELADSAKKKTAPTQPTTTPETQPSSETQPPPETKAAPNPNSTTPVIPENLDPELKGKLKQLLGS